MMSRSPLRIEIALLGLLSERPMHGYEIYQRLSAVTGLGLIWRVKQAQLYALLERLEEEGYVASTLESQPKAPPRKILALTARGRMAFDEWVRTPVASAREMRINFLAKLYFARQQGAEPLHHLVDAQRKACQVWVTRLEAESATAATPFDVLAWRFRVSQVKDMLRWLDA